MEDEVLRFILANQGAVSCEDLIFNSPFSDETSLRAAINNQQKFCQQHLGPQAKVVARTAVRLCRVKDCPGLCGNLHLCKHFLFSGSCHYSRRGRCTFSHDLSSLPNLEVLKAHELEILSRQELCTLLLQSDPTLLPPICYHYNNGDGEFGKCESGDACERMHICDRFLTKSCGCFRVHDFNAPQPEKTLRKRGVPDALFPSLKSTYANKNVLKNSERQQGRVNPGGFRGRGAVRGNRARSCTREQIQKVGSSLNVRDERKESDSGESVSVNDNNTRSEGSQNTSSRPNESSRVGRERERGQGNRGGRGYRAKSLTREQMRKATSMSNLFSPYVCHGHAEVDRDGVDSAAANDSDTCSEGGLQKNERPFLGPGQGRGRGNRRGRPARDKMDICMFFIKGRCIHEDNCFKAHDKMPYRWQIQEGNDWTALPDNELIERNYCDPKNTNSSVSPFVNFDTMTSGDGKVRRLSTLNSVAEKTYMLTTEWLWYWEDEFGRWHQYAAADGGHSPADIDSTQLEEKFLEDDKSVIQFTAHSQSYSLSFPDMIQTNVKYGTKKVVRRRPRFVSEHDVNEEKKRRRQLGQPKFSGVPTHWDKTQIPEQGYKLIPLSPTSEEYRQVEAHFGSTIKFGFVIETVERIQNKELWDVFNWQKNRMKQRSGEKRLFHGTDTKHVDAICLHNFDWRICGTHGTAYGQGSYFARDAKYSDSYTSDSVVRTMFLSRVLVGDYTTGRPEYRRPPAKLGSDVEFYDSCVDRTQDPSIFVIFEKYQIYPEYLIKYTKGSSSPQPKPALITPMTQFSSSLYSTSSSQASPLPYTFSTSHSQSSTSSSQASPSPYTFSTLHSQSSTSSSQASPSPCTSSTLHSQSSTSSSQASPSKTQATSSSVQSITSSSQASPSNTQASSSSVQAITSSSQASPSPCTSITSHSQSSTSSSQASPSKTQATSSSVQSITSSSQASPSNTQASSSSVQAITSSSQASPSPCTSITSHSQSSTSSSQASPSKTQATSSSVQSIISSSQASPSKTQATSSSVQSIISSSQASSSPCTSNTSHLQSSISSSQACPLNIQARSSSVQSIISSFQASPSKTQAKSSSVQSIISSYQASPSPYTSSTLHSQSRQPLYQSILSSSQASPSKTQARSSSVQSIISSYQASPSPYTSSTLHSQSRQPLYQSILSSSQASPSPYTSSTLHSQSRQPLYQSILSSSQASPSKTQARSSSVQSIISSSQASPSPYTSSTLHSQSRQPLYQSIISSSQASPSADLTHFLRGASLGSSSEMIKKRFL